MIQSHTTEYPAIHPAAQAMPDEGDEKIRSTLVSKNVTILGRRTSVRLEPEMWLALKDISRREGCSIHDICSLIQIRKNPMTSLTAAIRVFLMLYYRAASTEEGHHRAGHGNFENMRRRAKVAQEQIRNGIVPQREPDGQAAYLRVI